MSSSKNIEINILTRRNHNFQYLFLLSGTIIGLVIFTAVFYIYSPVLGEEYPTVKDKRLAVELVVEGLKLPTAMDFLGEDDILVIEKDNGTVRRVINGTLLRNPILDVGVATERERGMLGIAVAKRTELGLAHPQVFIYYTQSETSEDGLDNCPPPRPYYCKQDGEPLGNRIYRYEFADGELVNPKLLLDLPAKPGPNHNGGALLVGPDKNIYVLVGDLLPYYSKELGTKATNFRDSVEPDGRSGILRMSQDGNTVENGILGDKDPLNKYYSYGIRNGFGLDFDPITGNLWDTENGPGYGDEINLVEPGFNSGWAMVQGVWSPSNLNISENILNLPPEKSLWDSEKNKLIGFNGNGKYSDPEFIWNQTIGVTALTFLDSGKLGPKYKNDLFVGDITFGNIYHFDLNKNRTELILQDELEDKIAERIKTNQKSIKFGENFGGISDLMVGPYDGYLYVLSYYNGSIYRIIPEK
jgi:glucose/arabinose dehydrogenase